MHHVTILCDKALRPAGDWLQWSKELLYTVRVA